MEGAQEHALHPLSCVLCFPQVGILGEVSLRIFLSFPGVSFNMLMHQNECVVGLGSFSGQLHLYLGIFWL